jgi:hypothetical protein
MCFLELTKYMEQRVILENLVLQVSSNSPHFIEGAVPLSLSVQPANCPSADVLRNWL